MRRLVTKLVLAVLCGCLLGGVAWAALTQEEIDTLNAAIVMSEQIIQDAGEISVTSPEWEPELIQDIIATMQAHMAIYSDILAGG